MTEGSLKKILIVDDEPNIVKILAARLKAAGFDVITANDGLSGLHTVYRENPDLVIFDVMMPQMDGFTACQKLKSDRRYQDTPVLMLTAKTQEEDKNWGKMLGATDYITKPFDSKELVNKVKELLAIKE